MITEAEMRGRKRVLVHCRPWFGVIWVYHEQTFFFFFLLKLVQLEFYHDPKMLTNRERKSTNVRELTDEGERERKLKSQMSQEILSTSLNSLSMQVFQTSHQNY